MQVPFFMVIERRRYLDQAVVKSSVLLRSRPPHSLQELVACEEEAVMEEEESQAHRPEIPSPGISPAGLKHLPQPDHLPPKVSGVRAVLRAERECVALPVVGKEILGEIPRQIIGNVRPLYKRYGKPLHNLAGRGAALRSPTGIGSEQRSPRDEPSTPSRMRGTRLIKGAQGEIAEGTL